MLEPKRDPLPRSLEPKRDPLPRSLEPKRDPRARPLEARALAIGVAALATACSAIPPQCPTAGASPPPPARALPASSASAAAPAPVDLDVVLEPVPTPAPHVEVALTARGGDAALEAWRIPRSPGLAGEPSAADDAGAVPLKVTADGGALRITLGRRPTGALILRYGVQAGAPAFPDAPAVAVDPDRFDGSGEALLALPEAWAARAFKARITIDVRLTGTPELTDVASTFGVGQSREVETTGRRLWDAHYLAGILGRASFLAPEGRDDAVWLGYTAFDPRPAFADLAAFRTAVRQIFGDLRGEPLTVVLVTDPRPAGAFTASRRGDSIALRVGMGEPWSAPVRIAMATEVVHGWIGARLWIGPSDPEHEAEAYWFTEGVARALARDLLFRFGLISPAEMATEVEGLTALAATSPLRPAGNAALAKRPPGALPLLVARGALYATGVDARLRAKSRGARALPNVVRELYARAAEAKGPLPTAAWLDAVAKDLGEGERAAFAGAIERGVAAELPDTALGPCFRRVTRTYAAFDAGLDDEASAKEKRVIGLAPKGPAAKAGLVEGDTIVELRLTRGRSDVPVEIVVERAGLKKSFRYLPAGATAKAAGWERKKEVADDACTR